MDDTAAFDHPATASQALNPRQYGGGNDNNNTTAGTGTGANNNNNINPEDALSPLEQELLDEYARLVGNLDDLSAVLAVLATKPSAEILDALRSLERRTTTVFTLLKASVYSLVLQQEINYNGEG